MHQQPELIYYIYASVFRSYCLGAAEQKDRPSVRWAALPPASSLTLPAWWRLCTSTRPLGWWHNLGKSLGGGGGVPSAVAQTAVSSCSAKTVIFHIKHHTISLVRKHTEPRRTHPKWWTASNWCRKPNWPSRRRGTMIWQLPWSR